MSSTLTSQAMALEAARAALDRKAENLVILDIKDSSAFTSYFVICSAFSGPQIQAIGDSVRKALADHGVRPSSVEGYGEGRWLLLDFGSVVVHVFLDAIREYYRLEEFWAQSPKVPIPGEFYGPGATHASQAEERV